ncbi:MAG TPA: DUF4476 domain-containing protein [Ferruginibacter sp.]|nr:DUF4476 domain-containing protein [Ferruginibacter sp.]
MKKLSIVFLGMLAFLSLNAQRKSNLTVMVNGNSNMQVTIDGSSYNLTGSSGSATANITDLAPGQHTLQISRGNQYNNNRRDDISTTFTLRNRYDMKINVNADGSLALIENLRMRNGDNNQARISNTEYNQLWRSVRAQRIGEQRVVMINNAFSNRTNYFTSAQIVQLLQLVPTDGPRLQLAKQSYAYVSDPVNFSRVELLFNNEAARDELESYVSSYETDGNAYVYSAANYPTMSDVGYNSLYQNIRQQWPASTQYTSIANAFSSSGNYFTTAQAMQLIQLQTSESNRLSLAKMAYGRVVDSYNFTQVSNLLSYQSSKDDLAAYIRTYQPGTVYTSPVTSYPAMADADFNNTLQNVRSRFLPFEKMNTLTDIFNNRSNYFTSSQAKQLIELVSAESNRLQLAKSAYRNIVDKTNFRIVYDLLPSQSSRSELDAYISAYRE